MHFVLDFRMYPDWSLELYRQQRPIYIFSQEGLIIKYTSRTGEILPIIKTVTMGWSYFSRLLGSCPNFTEYYLWFIGRDGGEDVTANSAQWRGSNLTVSITFSPSGTSTDRSGKSDWLARYQWPMMRKEFPCYLLIQTELLLKNKEMNCSVLF